MNENTFYVTTPIYYPSDKLHIGHALTTTMADTLARFKKLQGYDVFFLTGSDEHGQKIQRKAQEAGKLPLEYVDEIVTTFKHLWQELDIEYDDFIRTTEERHKRVVQKIFMKIYEKGDIYISEYEGWYCTPCESFWSERLLKETEEGKTCPDCGRMVELIKEESYFFKMSKYADKLLDYIENNPQFIQPPSRRNETISFVNQGLEDLCVSRTTFDWGIPVPIKEDHVIYVWFDALTNYVSALGYGTENDERFQKYWTNAVHLVGKDIVRFHTIIWPIILMAADIPLPKTVYGHGWLLIGGGKMSKSKGNVVDPIVLKERYGSDAIRYYLLREMPKGEDGYYTEKALVERLNIDLANDFGNLLSRTTAMINKFSEGKVPQPGSMEKIDLELRDSVLKLPEITTAYLDDFDFSNALGDIWKVINFTNKYIDKTAPWSLFKDENSQERLNTVLYNMVEAIRVITVLVGAFMPRTPERVWQQLGIDNKPECQTWESLLSWGWIPSETAISRGEPLFPRLEIPEEPKEDSGGEQEVEEILPKVGIEDFRKIDIRTAQIIEAEKIKGSENLIKLQVDIGREKRQLVAGIAKSYAPSELIGKKAAVVVNLEPIKIMGVKSEGMLLAASHDDNFGLLILDKEMPNGVKIE